MTGTRWMGLIILILGIILLIIAGSTGQANYSITGGLRPSGAGNAAGNLPPTAPSGTQPASTPETRKSLVGPTIAQASGPADNAPGFGAAGGSDSGRAWLWVLGIAGVVIGAMMLIFGGRPGNAPPGPQAP